MHLLENIRRALPAILSSDERLASFAHDIGHALPKASDEELRELRNLLASTVIEDDHRAGLVSGVIEVIDGYRASTAAARRVEAAAAELREGLSRDMISVLARRSSTTGELAAALGKSDSEISRALSRLRKLDLVDSTRDVLDSRFRPHRLSLQGRLLAERTGLLPQTEQEEIEGAMLYEWERQHDKGSGFLDATGSSFADLGSDGADGGG